MTEIPVLRTTLDSKDTRQVIIPSGYAGFGSRETFEVDAPIDSVTHAKIQAYIDAVTVEAGNGREIDEDLLATLSRPVEEISALMRVLEASGEIEQPLPFAADASPHRSFMAKSERAAALVALYAATILRQSFRTCQHCGATFACAHRAKTIFCSEKCRAASAHESRKRLRQATPPT